MRQLNLLLLATAVTVAAYGQRPRVLVQAVPQQRDELVKTMLRHCESVAVTLDPAHADFTLNLEREAGGGGLSRFVPSAGAFHRRNKWVLSDGDGDVVAAGSDRSVGGVAKDACAAIKRARTHSR